MAKGKLSERQRKIIEFIGDYSRDRGFPPTIREIGEKVGISSTSVVNYNLKKLEREGHILREGRVSRGVRLADQNGKRKGPLNDVVGVPLKGYIFASMPTLVGDTPQTADDEMIDLTRGLLPEISNLFALRVKGDSMIDAMVSDGDVVVLKPVTEARNGDMVALWLTDRNETTLKYFYKENGRIRLQPANPTMQPIIVSDPSKVKIQGKVVLVLRQLH